MMSGMKDVGFDCPDAKIQTLSSSHITHHLGLPTERDLRASIGSAVQLALPVTTLSIEEREILSGILSDLLTPRPH
jgi:hypothetical protein